MSAVVILRAFAGMTITPPIQTRGRRSGSDVPALLRVFLFHLLRSIPAHSERCAAPPTDNPKRYSPALVLQPCEIPDGRLSPPPHASASPRQTCRHGPSSARSYPPAFRESGAAFRPLWAPYFGLGHGRRGEP